MYVNAEQVGHLLLISTTQKGAVSRTFYARVRALMKYTEFASTGEKVSELCLGTMMFGGRCSEAEADRILGSAVDHGVNWIDTAAMYGDGLTEEILGRIMQGRRDKLFLTTKVHKGVDRASIVSSIDESLAR